ncbi:MAG: hypothetical protein GXN96_06870 [Aquificae bacterium]|nr:hypothetical protein [Aquificota bacterium]
MTWKKTLRTWYLSLVANSSLTLQIALLFFLLNFLIIVPLVAPFTFFLQNLLNFSLILFFGKAYLSAGGDERTYEEKLKAVSSLREPLSYLKESFFLVLAQYVMTALLLVFLLIALIAAGAVLGISLLAFGTTPPWWALLLYGVIVLFLYFSIATSYPLFFARALLESSNPRDFFLKFLTAPFSSLLLRMNFSLELFLSSLVISTFTLVLFLVQWVLYYLFPPAVLFSYFFTFVNLLLLYLFGLISLYKFATRD